MERHSYDPADKSGFPDDCLIDFDMRLIDLFKEMDKKSLNDFYQKYQPSEKIISHMQKVAELSEEIGSKLINQGEIINLELLKQEKNK